MSDEEEDIGGMTWLWRCDCGYFNLGTATKEDIENNTCEGENYHYVGVCESETCGDATEMTILVEDE